MDANPSEPTSPNVTKTALLTKAQLTRGLRCSLCYTERRQSDEEIAADIARGLGLKPESCTTTLTMLAACAAI